MTPLHREFVYCVVDRQVGPKNGWITATETGSLETSSFHRQGVSCPLTTWPGTLGVTSGRLELECWADNHLPGVYESKV